MNSTTAGTASTAEPAKMDPIALAWNAAPVWVKLATATASGCMLCFFVIKKGHRNSFQGPMNVTSAAVRMAGRTSGTAIDHRMRNSPCLLYTSDAADDLLCV